MIAGAMLRFRASVTVRRVLNLEREVGRLRNLITALVTIEREGRAELEERIRALEERAEDEDRDRLELAERDLEFAA